MEAEKGYISKCISASWRALKPDEKRPFQRRAAELARLHKLAMLESLALETIEASEDITDLFLGEATVEEEVLPPFTPRSLFLFFDERSLQSSPPAGMFDHFTGQEPITPTDSDCGSSYTSNSGLGKRASV